MFVYRSYLSVVTRSSGYAIAILLPQKDNTYAVLGSSQLDGPYDPLHLLGYIVGLWDAAVNQPRLRQGLAPIGPHCLLCNPTSDLDVINQMLKQTGGVAATDSQSYACTAAQTGQALLDLRNQLATQQILATAPLTAQLHRALNEFKGDLTQGFAFEQVPLALAAIAQVRAYEQAVPLVQQPPSPTDSLPVAPPSSPQPSRPTEGWLKQLIGRFF
ncbi:MAG: hypothetical protein AAFU71_15665 [Cyanobacteria bacterium J06632_22]